ncbi:replicative DNA helicase [Lipingzhangella halophila]|uniref:Replicative DNA helicase n=1 Tax=Lipingzhangella halophila TaxID=1783352 RepID=A0A7W7W2A8_9ACTN|nr:replicative DNA helicase [Lipingzhangella halophila]MBB4931812.1 replicative DNA helicase [Lipingzhangella halophila]
MTATEEEVRAAPSDIPAEQAALGGMLISKAAIRQVQDVLGSAEAFCRSAHQMIYQAALAVDATGDPVDAISVAAELERRGELARCGHAPYLHTLTESIPTAANAGYYARRVAEKAVLRGLVEAGTEIAKYGYEGEGDAADLVERANKLLAQVEAPNASGGAEMTHISEVYLHVVDDQEVQDDTLLVQPPYADLRDIVPGIKPGQMVIVGARPSVGKSVVAADFARHVSMRQGIGTALFSLEMTQIEMGQRIMAAETGIEFQRLRDKKLTDEDWQRTARVYERFARAPFWLSNDFGASLAQIKARVRQLARTHDIGLVVVDYLQLMEGGNRPDSRQQEVSAMSRGLKRLAGELGVVVVVLSQLNRGLTQRADKRPQLSDLRESGSIEQDADVVILLDRPDANEKQSPRSGEIDLLVEKNRHGPSKCEVTCAFQGHYSRIVDMAGTSWGSPG